MQEFLLRVRYFERVLSKVFRKVNQPLLMDKVIKKQKELETSDQSLFRFQNKFKKNLLLVIYYQTKFDGVI